MPMRHADPKELTVHHSSFGDGQPRYLPGNHRSMLQTDVEGRVIWAGKPEWSG